MNINLPAVDGQWEAGFPQLLLYSGDSVWRESVGGLNLLSLSGAQFEFQTRPTLATLKASIYVFHRRKVIAHAVVILIGFPAITVGKFIERALIM